MPRCLACGTDFEISAAQAAAYPGWTPKECSRCYRASAGRGGSASRRAGGGRSRRTAGAEEHLTVDQVLAKYHDGPAEGVFTDGSASPNPGPGGWGAVYVRDGQVVDRDWGHDPDTTNNRMELTALLQGIALVPQGVPTLVYSDSRLAVDTVTKWAGGWAARGWRRKSGPVKNLDLVRPLYELCSERPEIELRWIAAHVGNRWNEYADALSTAWMRDEV